MSVTDDVRAALPYIVPKLNPTIQMVVELGDTMYSKHAKGTPQDINFLGARVNFTVFVNSNYGNMLDAGYFREGGGHVTKQAVVGFTHDSIAHQVSADYFTGMKGAKAIGGSIASLMKQNIAKVKKERDVDFCRGDGTGTRAIVSSVTSSTVLVMDSADGARYIDADATRGEIYFFHHPTTFVQHGATAGHRALSKSGNTVTWSGDLTDNTDVAANDIIVHKGGADNVSSINKAIFGYEHFFTTGGEYFGLDRDVDTLLNANVVDAGGAMLSFSLLEKGQTKWFYRWNEAAPDNLCDVLPPCQEAAYKLKAYGLRRIDASTTSFDGAIKKITDGGHVAYIDANVRNTNWFRYDPATIERYEFRPTGIWDDDGLQMRAPQGNGSVQAVLFWIIAAAEGMFCNNPARGIAYSNLGVAGLQTSA